MKKNFEYVNAPTMGAALQALDEYKKKAMLVAGGTNVMVYIRKGRCNDRVLVNIRDIRELRGISCEDGIVTVGALTTISDISKSEILRKYASVLYSAGNVFADPTTRNSATIGGNVANAGAGGDTIPPLLVLDAIAHVKSLGGERTIPISNLFIGPGRTCIAPNELLTHFTFKAETHVAFIKLCMRKAMSISMVCCAAYAKLNGDVIDECRIGLGAVAPTPVRAYNAEAALMGGRLDEKTFNRIAEVVQMDMNPRDPSVRATVTYRRRVTPVLIERAVRKAALGECL